MNAMVPEEILRLIHNLSPQPTVVVDLQVRLDQDDVATDAMAQKIARDPSLTAGILRLANSSFYGMAHQVTTVQEAIAILGFRTVLNVVNSKRKASSA